MRNKSPYICGYLGCVIMLVTTFFPGIISIFYNYKSADSIAIYSIIIFIIILIIFLGNSDMRKKKNIIILVILNGCILLIPWTILFILAKPLGTMYITEIINKKYFQFILEFISEGSTLTWYLPGGVMNLTSIILFIYEYRKIDE